MRRPRLAACALALGGAACGGDADPCEGHAGRCVVVHVRSASVDEIDQLELDVLYGDRHGTTTTQPAGGGTVALPLATAITLGLEPPGALRVGVVGAGKLGGNVLGTGAATALVEPDAHVAITLELAPPAACVAGAFYCGGDKLAGDPQTLYQCNGGGVPLARGLCTAGCTVRPTLDDTCAADGGPCIEGGFYCGGDKLEGDPQKLYRCAGGVGTAAVECADGCIVSPPGTDDRCR